jgi:hypothetical protein
MRIVTLNKAKQLEIKSVVEKSTSQIAYLWLSMLQQEMQGVD